MKSNSKVVVWLVYFDEIFLDIASKSNIIAISGLLMGGCLQSPRAKTGCASPLDIELVWKEIKFLRDKIFCYLYSKCKLIL